MSSPSSKVTAFPDRRPDRRRAGFTLVEVTMAVMVLAFGIAGSITALRIGFDMIETARDQTMASQILQSEIETLRLMNWVELTDLPEEETFAIESDFDESIQNRYTGTRRIEEARPDVQIKRIVLQINWTSSNGVERELTYETRIARNGINDYYSRAL